MGAVKTQDIPVPLRTWWDHFKKASYRHDYYRVFDDFLTMTLTQFTPPGDEFFKQWHADAMKPYSTEEKKWFTEMYFEIFKIFHREIEDHGKPYYDMFGHMYETLSSQSKKSGFGQFFTPEGVVEMMVDLQMPELETGAGKRISDPCCGSGRMLFIAHVKAPGNFQYGIDIDSTCVKMTAINMLFHGCVGEVVCGNGLFLESDYRYGLSINPLLRMLGTPSIMKLEKEDSYQVRQWEHWKKTASLEKEMPVREKKSRKKEKNTVEMEIPAKPADVKISGSQLNIFDF